MIEMVTSVGMHRYARATILHKAAALLRSRVEEASDLITLESGLCKKDSRYEVGRVCDVLNFSASEALKDDGQSFSCSSPAPFQSAGRNSRRPLLWIDCLIDQQRRWRGWSRAFAAWCYGSV